jgi:guanosine-3',5'-bis(diphosphate) 3'-pyrophosphohydrolase
MISMWSQDLYIKAYRFAAEAHNGQLVPGTELPYIVHPSLVCMEIVAALNVEKGNDENLAVQCALLHDVIEDTEAPCEQLRVAFGENVAEGVMALSKNKALRKSQQMGDCLRRIRLQPIEIWMVKMADRITNLQPPPLNWTRQKIMHYRVEAIAIFQAMKDASPFLASRLSEKIDKYGSFI